MLAALGFSFGAISSYGQAGDGTSDRVIEPKALLFEPTEKGFEGAGWELIASRVATSTHVLVGEDHFIHEIPGFVEAIAQQRVFTDFLCEMDPLSAKVLEAQLRGTSSDLLKEMPATFSFYGQREECDLTKALVSKGVHLSGADQVVMNADRLLAQDLLQRTKEPSVRAVLERMRDSSAVCFARFLVDPSQPMYMLTSAFEADLDSLASSASTDPAIQEVVAALRESRAIYMSQSHQRRVDLLRANFNASGVAGAGHSALLKFGAIHGPRGESLFGMPDIGEALAHTTDSLGGKSLHIMVVGMTGSTGSPFPGFPGAVIDPTADPLAALAPFFAVVNGAQWHCFDLSALRSSVALKAGESDREALLRRVVQGYDLLVVIPQVAPGSF